MRALLLLPLLLTAILTLSPAAAPAGEQEGQAAPLYPLFEHYMWGMAYSDLEAREGMQRVQPGEGDDAAVTADGKFRELYLPGATWAGHDWTAHFAFTRDSLDNVTLIAPYQRQTFNDVRTKLAGDGYVILGILIDDKALDLFQLMQFQGPEAFNKRFLELIREKTPRRVSYDYFMTMDISDEQMRLTTSINQFLLGMDAGHMQIEVTMLGGEAEGSAPQTLCVNFTYPALARAKAIERPTKSLQP